MTQLKVVRYSVRDINTQPCLVWHGCTSRKEQLSFTLAREQQSLVELRPHKLSGRAKGGDTIDIDLHLCSLGGAVMSQQDDESSHQEMSGHGFATWHEIIFQLP